MQAPQPQAVQAQISAAPAPEYPLKDKFKDPQNGDVRLHGRYASVDLFAVDRATGVVGEKLEDIAKKHDACGWAVSVMFDTGCSSIPRLILVIYHDAEPKQCVRFALDAIDVAGARIVCTTTQQQDKKVLFAKFQLHETRSIARVGVMPRGGVIKEIVQWLSGLGGLPLRARSGEISSVS